MNIIEAKQTLEKIEAGNKSEGDAIKLALSILNDTFEPNMISLQLSQEDADIERARAHVFKTEKENLAFTLKTEVEAHIIDNQTKEAEKAEKDALIETIVTTLAEKEIVISELETAVSEKDAVVATLIAEKELLVKENEELKKTPVKEEVPVDVTPVEEVVTPIE